MEQGSRKIQYLATFTVSLAFIALGVTSAWPTPVLVKLRRGETKIDITDDGIAWMLSMNPLGFILGSFITRFTSDRCGRRATILYSVLPIAIGSFTVAWARYAWQLCFTTFIWSCGTGMLSTVVGVYLAEITDKDIRGTLAIATKFTFNFGNLLAIVVGPFVSFETLNYMILPLPFCYFAACWWIPESPYFLLKEGKIDAARKDLKRLRGLKDDKVLEEELLLLQSGVNKEMKKSSSVVELFTGKQYRKAIIIATGLKFTQIMTGAGTIKQYMGVILQESQLPKKYESTAFIAYGGITFVVGIMSSILVDRVGRRPLLIHSYIGTAVSLAAVGVYFFLLEVVEVPHDSLIVYGFVPFTGIVLSNVISTLGYNSLLVIIPAEIFPLNVKAVAMTSLSIFGGILGFVIAKTYQWVKDMAGLATVFWIFAAVAILGAFFCYLVIPETKGKNLQEIQLELQGDTNAVELKQCVNGDAVCEPAELQKLQSKN